MTSLEDPRFVSQLQGVFDGSAPTVKSSSSGSTKSCPSLPSNSLIWLDATIDPRHPDFSGKFGRLRAIIYDVHIFHELEECVDYLTDVDAQQVFLITSGSIGRKLLPLVHSVPCLNTIYVLCEEQYPDEEWSHQWTQI